MRYLPLNTWIVIEQKSPGKAKLISKHPSQKDAETERDRRNRGQVDCRFIACKLVEPVAQRMGGRHAPSAGTHAAARY